jgi:hypothetical protein
MTDKDTLVRWGTVSAIAAGLVSLVPLVFYFYLLRRVGAGRTFRPCSRCVSPPLSPNRT